MIKLKFIYKNHENSVNNTNNLIHLILKTYLSNRTLND